MKTLTEIHEQENRIYNLLHTVSSNQIKKVHPETGGSLHLAHNWGNEAAQNILSIHRERSSFLFKLFKKHYHTSFCNTYPDHLAAKKSTN